MLEAGDNFPRGARLNSPVWWSRQTILRSGDVCYATGGVIPPLLVIFDAIQ